MIIVKTHYDSWNSIPLPLDVGRNDSCRAASEIRFGGSIDSREAGWRRRYLWLLLRSWSHATSALLGEGTFKGINPFWLTGGVVRESTYRLISACRPQ
jgi:hypothetical protein